MVENGVFRLIDTFIEGKCGQGLTFLKDSDILKLFPQTAMEYSERVCLAYFEENGSKMEFFSLKTCLKGK